MSQTPRKTRTRGNRDGKPYKRDSDGKWVAVAYYPNGKRKPCYGSSAKEAAEKRKKFYAELEAGEPVTVGRVDSLARYLDQWVQTTLPQRVQAGHMSADTLDSYRDTVRLHITPHLGGIKIADLSTHHLRVWLMELAKKPSGRQRRTLRPGETELPPPTTLSPRTQAYAHAVLRAALADAVKDEVVKRNVCLLVDPPKKGPRSTRTPTKEEAGALLAAAADDRLWAYWLIVLALGLRRGEGLGLRWSGVDLDAKTVRLSKAIGRSRGEVGEDGKRKGQLVEKDLKTEASKATMRLPAYAAVALKRWRATQRGERLAARSWADPDLVFTTTIGTPLEPRNVNRSWAAICARAGVGSFRIHDLRHAAATFLFAAGEKEKTVQAFMRHTRMATTVDIYMDVLEEVRDETASTMDGVLRALAGGS